jgi:GNAT superfamily N-acetyltransferase
VKVREIEESEFEAVANLRVDAFLAAGMVKDRGTPYAQYLRTVPDHAQHGYVLVAYEDEILVGTVTIAPPGSPHADIAVAGEWEVRFLAVAVDAWGTGVGDTLMAQTMLRLISSMRALGSFGNPTETSARRQMSYLRCTRVR